MAARPVDVDDAVQDQRSVDAAYQQYIEGSLSRAELDSIEQGYLAGVNEGVSSLGAFAWAGIRPASDGVVNMIVGHVLRRRLNEAKRKRLAYK